MAERLNFAVKAVKVAGLRPIAPQVLAEWKKLIPAAPIDPRKDRRAQLGEIARRELGLTSVELEPIPTRKIGGHEVYRLSSSGRNGIVKIFLGKDGFEEAAREAAADEFLARSAGTLKGVRVEALVQTDGAPLMILSLAPGKSVTKLIEGGGEGALTAVRQTARALAEFHAKHSTAATAQAGEYRAREHSPKLRRWFSIVDKPKTTLDALREKRWITPAEWTSLRRKIQKAISDYETRLVTKTTVVHGDAHPKNFYYDAASGQVTAIDTAYMGYTLDAVGDPMEDLGRAIQGSLRAAVDQKPEARAALESEWLKGYFGKTPPDEVGALYYRLRFLQLVLDADEVTRVQARALLTPLL